MRFKSSGIVLSRRTIRETDLLVSVLTEDRGRVSALARGAQRSLRRFLGGIDLFDCAEFEFFLGSRKRAFPTLESLSGREVWLGLRNDLRRCAIGMLCLELAEEFLPENDVDGGRMFAPLQGALRHLNESRGEGEMLFIAVRYLFLILDHGGYSPVAGSTGSFRSHFVELSRVPLLNKTGDVRAMFEPRVFGAISDSGATPPSEDVAQVLRREFFSLLSYAEEIIGRRLKTRHGVLTQLDAGRAQM